VIQRGVGMIPPEEIVPFASKLLGNRAARRAMKVTVHKVRKTPSWPRSWANFSLL
jgi:hypothetical protein